MPRIAAKLAAVPLPLYGVREGPPAVLLAQVEVSLVETPVVIDLSSHAFNFVVLETSLVVAVPRDREPALAGLLAVRVPALVREGPVRIHVLPLALPLPGGHAHSS